MDKYMTNNVSMTLLNTIAQAIYDKKGMNILALDLHGVSSMTDYVIIAEGNIDRHLKAIAMAIKDTLQQNNLRSLFVEGEKEGDWIVMDFGEVMIHLLTSDFREKYALEELWREARIVDLNIVVA
jgi:ribosome-associated protein